MDVVAVGGKNESNFGALKMVVSGIFWSLNIKGEMGNDRDAPLEGERHGSYGIGTHDKQAREQEPAVAYFRTSSASNVGDDKDSLKRQRSAVQRFRYSAELSV